VWVKFYTEGEGVVTQVPTVDVAFFFLLDVFFLLDLEEEEDGLKVKKWIKNSGE
jgi:hypothetical protein